MRQGFRRLSVHCTEWLAREGVQSLEHSSEIWSGFRSLSSVIIFVHMIFVCGASLSTGFKLYSRTQNQVPFFSTCSWNHKVRTKTEVPTVRSIVVVRRLGGRQMFPQRGLRLKRLHGQQPHRERKYWWYRQICDWIVSSKHVLPESKKNVCSQKFVPGKQRNLDEIV